MKVTVVPAQVTTVEDRIAGSLGLSQILLLVAPVFIDSALYVGLPPFFHGAVYKLAVIATITLVLAVMAIRIKGQILLFWLITLLKYNLRPRFYVFEKRTLANREMFAVVKTEPAETEAAPAPKRLKRALSLTTADLVQVRDLIEHPAANLSFETRKGNLYVRITEVKQEG